MRVLKDPEVRRTEILDAAQALFAAKGYGKTTIVDILTAVGIAKGTFYYYFKSKEEVMEAVLVRFVEASARRAAQAAADPALDPLEKFQRALLAQRPEQDGPQDRLLDQLHQPHNAELHQRGLVLGIRSLAPILAGIVEEGMEAGVFSTPCPCEAVEVLLVSGQVLFDEGLFAWAPQVLRSKARAFARIAETTLGAEAGSFPFLEELLGG